MNSIIKPLCSFIKSSIGRKMIVAVTGTMLYLFLAGHMAGNLTVFWGPDALNSYAHHLQSLPWPFLWGFRVAMLAIIGIHVLMTLKLKLENMAARQPYEVKHTIKATISSRTMVITGLMLFCFIVFHILNYTVHVGYNMADYMTTLDDHDVTDVYKVITDGRLGFGNPLISGIYILGMILLFSHLKHGVQSTFQTVGFNSRKVSPFITLVSNLYATVICLGMISIPVAVLAGYLK